MAKSNFSLLQKALEDAGLGGIPEAELRQYMADMGLSESELNDSWIAQIVDDVAAQSAKQQSAIAVQENKPAKATRGKPAKATAQPQQQADPQHAFSGIAGQVSAQVNDLVEVVEEECTGWEQGAAAYLHNRFASVPNNILGHVAGMAEEARYNAADFREQVRAGIGAFRTY